MPVKNKAMRILVSIIVIIVPSTFLFKGIFGSFIFTFSIPILWQFGILGRPIIELGIRPCRIKTSIVAGIVTGCVLGFAGGSIIKSIGMAGYLYSSLHKLQFSFGPLNIAFSLQKELGYRLLTMSNSYAGLFAYLMFSIFLIGLGEEFFWRGFVQQKLSGYIPVNMAIGMTAILFSLIHFYIFTIVPLKEGVIFLLLIAVAGIAWGYLLKYFGNIWPSVVSHGVTAFIIWKYYFFR